MHSRRTLWLIALSQVPECINYSIRICWLRGQTRSGFQTRVPRFLKPLLQPAPQEAFPLRNEYCEPSEFFFLSRVPGCLCTQALVLTEREKSSPQRPESSLALTAGHGVLLWKINISIDHQHQTRLLGDREGTKQTKRLLYSHAGTQTKMRTFSKPQKMTKDALFLLFLY